MSDEKFDELMAASRMLGPASSKPEVDEGLRDLIAERTRLEREVTAAIAGNRVRIDMFPSMLPLEGHGREQSAQELAIEVAQGRVSAVVSGTEEAFGPGVRLRETGVEIARLQRLPGCPEVARPEFVKQLFEGVDPTGVHVVELWRTRIGHFIAALSYHEDGCDCVIKASDRGGDASSIALLTLLSRAAEHAKVSHAEIAVELAQLTAEEVAAAIAVASRRR